MHNYKCHTTQFILRIKNTVERLKQLADWQGTYNRQIYSTLIFIFIHQNDHNHRKQQVYN